MVLHSLSRRVLRGPRVDRPIISPLVTTERLTLRPYRRDDAADWFAIQSIAEVNHYMKWPDRDAARSRAHLRDRTRHTRLSQVNDFLALAVEVDGHVVGDVSLRLKAVHPDTRNVEIAFDDLGARWATALIDLTNVRSIAVAERLGLRGIPLDGDSIAFFGSPAVREAHAHRMQLHHDLVRRLGRRD